MTTHHRKTTTWIPADNAQGYAETPQYWHWYECDACGDKWEMFHNNVDRPKTFYWCPSCRAKGKS